MFLSRGESRIRLREAQRARDNRGEIVRALSHGQIARRDLFRWGIFTASGALVCKNGLSPFARSAFAAVPTGTPRSPLFNAQKFTQRMPRLDLQRPITLMRNSAGEAVFPANLGEPPARRLSYHTDFTASGGTRYKNPLTGRGPMEGRPPGEYFAHQRWEEFFPKVGYVMSWGQIVPEQPIPSRPAGAESQQRLELRRRPLHPRHVAAVSHQGPVWRADTRRIYNNTPVKREENEGFGRTRRSCISTTPTTVRKATAPPMPTISRARSTTTGGARRWRGATRSTSRPATGALRDRTAPAG